MSDFGQIDDMAVLLGPVADDRIFPRTSGEVDPQEEAALRTELLLRQRLRGEALRKSSGSVPCSFCRALSETVASPRTKRI